jgi:hypothetical protein
MRKNTRPGARAQVQRRLFEGLIESRQARLHHHRHVRHAEGDMRKRDGHRPYAPGPADQLLQGDEEQQQGRDP